jgi:hypothetical protein
MEDIDILEELIGLDKQSAFDLCETNGYDFRITREDSVVYICTQDLNFNRINLRIDNGKVTGCNIG